MCQRKNPFGVKKCKTNKYLRVCLKAVELLPPVFVNSLSSNVRFEERCKTLPLVGSRKQGGNSDKFLMDGEMQGRSLKLRKVFCYENFCSRLSH